MYVFGILVYRDLSRQIQRQWPGYRHVIITLYYLCLFIFICRFSLSRICEKLGPVRYLYAIPSTPPLAILCSRYDRLIYAFFVIIIPKCIGHGLLPPEVFFIYRVIKRNISIIHTFEKVVGSG